MFCEIELNKSVELFLSPPRKHSSKSTYMNWAGNWIENIFVIARIVVIRVALCNVAG